MSCVSIVGAQSIWLAKVFLPPRGMPSSAPNVIFNVFFVVVVVVVVSIIAAEGGAPPSVCDPAALVRGAEDGGIEDCWTNA